MKRHINIIIFSFLISSCCSYDKKDFDFNSNELKHFSNYKTGDTIYFQSNLGDIDTITIVGFETEINKNCGGFMAPPPINGKWIKIEHLPVDKWHGTTREQPAPGKIKIDPQELFWISKRPDEKMTEYGISFKDFHSGFDTLIGKFHKEPLILNGLKFSDYYEVKHRYPERVTDAKNIETVYWTDRLGLTAYKNKDGETWTRTVSTIN